MKKPLLLDLFCGAGGAAMGYHRAGFEAIGVDINPQPEYPFEFHQADALTFDLNGFDAVHASPPCQHYSAMNRGTCTNHTDYPDLVGPTRELLNSTGLPWVIENVTNAPLVDPVMLCGEMFDLKVIRHRNFESNTALGQPDHPRHRGYAASSYKSTFYYYTVAGNSDGKLGTLKDWQGAMGIDWIHRRKSLVEAIPPAYTEHIGRQLMAVLP